MADRDQVEFGDDDEEDIIDDDEDEDRSLPAPEPRAIHDAEDPDDDQDDIDIEDEGEEGLELDMADDDDEDDHENRDRGAEYQGEGYGEEGVQRNKRKQGEAGGEEEGGGCVSKVEGGEAKRGSVEVDDTHQKGAGGSGEEDVYQGEEGRDAIHAGGKMEDSKKEGGRGQEEDPMARPPHGSEVFIGGITKNVVEDDLKELCANCGHIFELRLVRDNEKGENKGFAFITFTSKEGAEKAIETLNGRELKGRKLRFSSSQANNKLFIGNIPKNWSKEEFQRVLLEKGVGITNLELLMDPQNSERNRGFAFVEYYNHSCAENARRKLTMPGFKFGTNIPTVNWADARGTGGTGESATATSQAKVIYVRNLPEGATEEQVLKLFEPHGEISKVVLPPSRPGQPKRDFGFIHYVDRSGAVKAIDKAHKYVLGDRELEVCLARPHGEKKPAPMYTPVGAGILPQMYQSRVGGSYGHADLGMMDSAGFGLNRGYAQPVIYGRGPAPAGMAMVPMVLPDGRMGYVLQQSGIHGMPAPYRDHRTSGRGSPSQRHGGGAAGSGGSRRYRPY